jgi:predicted PurR-regulated permease PerM
LLRNKFILNCLKIICVLLIIFLFTKVSFLLNPLVTIANILMLPLLFSGFLFYAMRPLVNRLHDGKMSRSLAIFIVFLIFIGLFVLLGMVVWPVLRDQIQSINVDALVRGFQYQVDSLQKSRLASILGAQHTNWTSELSGYLQDGVKYVTKYLTSSISAFTGFLLVISTVPFILFYMLKEGDRMSPALLKMIPKRYRGDGREMLQEMDSALSGYIVGRIIITSLLAIMMFIGFLIVGVPNALLLAVISFIFNLIPFIGQFLGAIPCLLVAFIDSPIKAVWVLLVILIAQQLESSFLAPQVYGKRLDIHPLTTVVLVLVSADLIGLVGILAAIPIYMIIKLFTIHVYRLFFANKIDEIVD